MDAVIERLLLVLGCAVIMNAACNSQGTNDVICELTRRIASAQVKENKTFIPFLQWKQDQGTYGSDIRVYTYGPEELAFFRDHFKVFDNNFFATSLVTGCLLEVSRYGPRSLVDEKELVSALGAMSEYRDRNRVQDTAMRTFWPQTYNKTTNFWQSAPENLLNLFAEVEKLPVPTITKLMEELGLKSLAEIIEQLWAQRNMFLTAFRIPADFDDTFVNIGVGALLQAANTSFPVALATWRKNNPNVMSALEELKKYAYRPLSPDLRVNTIDSRTYFYLRRYLEYSANAGGDLALVPTWAQDLDEVMTLYSKGVAMPFNVNNVDATVSANTLFGITAAVLSGLLPPSVLDDPDVNQIVFNTTSMLAFLISVDLSQRRDLALTYYPSVFEFFWFVTRTFSAIQERAQSGTLPHPTLDAIRKMLELTLSGHMTSVIVGSAQSEGDDKVYFDDFIGDGDRNLFNETVIRGEDRIFTTAVAVNALLNTWAVYDVTKSTLKWTPGTPSAVVDTVGKAVNWLQAYSVSGSYLPWNAVFSGSVKSIDSLPFWYPSNRIELLNGTWIPDPQQIPAVPFLSGMLGIVSSQEYDNYLTKPHFGRTTPTTFPGYNSLGASNFFPFWCSEAYTYATTLLAIVKHQQLQ